MYINDISVPQFLSKLKAGRVRAWATESVSLFHSLIVLEISDHIWQFVCDAGTSQTSQFTS